MLDEGCGSVRIQSDNSNELTVGARRNFRGAFDRLGGDDPVGRRPLDLAMVTPMVTQ